MRFVPIYCRPRLSMILVTKKRDSSISIKNFDEFFDLILFIGFQSVKLVLRLAANRFLLEPDAIEENLVHQSLRDIVVPGIKPKDLPLFNSIIDDLFPKINFSDTNHKWLRDTFQNECDKSGYEPIDLVYKKLCEVYEMSVHRKAIALVGNPYTGKSFVLKTLAAAIAAKNQITANEMDVGMLDPNCNRVFD